jgi:hypothetical protein
MKDNNGNNIEIPKDTEEKDLGSVFRQNLKFDSHIIEKSNKANKLLGMVKRTFSFMDKQLFLCIYKTLIRSILDYGSPICNPSTEKYRQVLENVQRRSTKIVPGLESLTYEERLVQLNLPTLYYRRRRFDMIQLYKMINETYFDFHLFTHYIPMDGHNVTFKYHITRRLNLFRGQLHVF